MLSTKLTLDDVLPQIKSGTRCLVRVDFNVPLDKKTNEITSTQRIEAALPTIRALSAKGARVILMSHLGRPEGVEPKLSLSVVTEALKKLLPELSVSFVDECVGEKVNQSVETLGAGAVLLLENLRFHSEETSKKITEEVTAFRSALSSLADVYINDAFGTCHRAHSSMVGIDVPLRAAGALVGKELKYFAAALESPERPFLAILGGAKVSDKILLIENLLDKVNTMAVVGGMAFTFKKVINGVSIGNSLFDETGAKIVQKIVAKAKEKNVELVFPTDYVTADAFSPDAKVGAADDTTGIPDGFMGLDAGPKSRARLTEVILASKTIIWNGPAGVFEFEAFAEGTRAGLVALAEATKLGATTIIGGGDTATAAAQFGFDDEVSHVSTGGGASLELLEGKPMPGIIALADKGSKL